MHGDSLPCLLLVTSSVYLMLFNACLQITRIVAAALVLGLLVFAMMGTIPRPSYLMKNVSHIYVSSHALVFGLLVFALMSTIPQAS